MRVLIVDRRTKLGEVLREFLETKTGPDDTLFTVHVHSDYHEAYEVLQRAGGRYDAVIVDDTPFADTGGSLDLVKVARAQGIVPLVYFSSRLDMQRVIEVMRAGAWDYIRKDAPERLLENIVQSLGRAAAEWKLLDPDPDVAWVNENYKELLQQYAHKYIVVFHQKVVDMADTYSEVAEVVKHFTRGKPTVCHVVLPS